MKTACLLFSIASTARMFLSSHAYEYEWKQLSTLPSARSDFTSTIVPSKNNALEDEIYLMGGCSSDYVATDDTDKDSFSCSQVSDTVWKYHPDSDSYEVMAPMPTPRHRHTATLVFDEGIWVIGGRDANDKIVETVDLYDTKNNTWQTIGRVDDAVSDHGAFFREKDLTVCTVGGYDKSYAALDEVQCVNVLNTMLNVLFGTCPKGNCISLDETPVPSMLAPRAGISASISNDQRHVYVTGGFHRPYRGNVSCVMAVASVEIFHAHNPSWSYAPDLTSRRGGINSAVLGDSLFALGGEVEKNCNGKLTLPRNSFVDIISASDRDEALWTNLAAKRFMQRSRFATSADIARESIYTFGGRGSYNSSCDCYPLDGRVFSLHVPGITAPQLSTQNASQPTSNVSENESISDMSLLGSDSEEMSESVLKNETKDNVAVVSFSVLMRPGSGIYESNLKDGTEQALSDAILNTTNQVLCEDTNIQILTQTNDANVLHSVCLKANENHQEHQRRRTRRNLKEDKKEDKKDKGKNEGKKEKKADVEKKQARKQVTTVINTDDWRETETQQNENKNEDMVINEDTGGGKQQQIKVNTKKEETDANEQEKQQQVEENTHNEETEDEILLDSGEKVSSETKEMVISSVEGGSATNGTIFLFDKTSSLVVRDERESFSPGQNPVEWLSFEIRYEIRSLEIPVDGMKEERMDDMNSARESHGGSRTLSAVNLQEIAREALEKRIQDGTFLQQLQLSDTRVVVVSREGHEADTFSSYADSFNATVPEEPILEKPSENDIGSTDTPHKMKDLNGLYAYEHGGPMHTTRIIGTLLLLFVSLSTALMTFLAAKRRHESSTSPKGDGMKTNLCTDEGVSFMLNATREDSEGSQKEDTVFCTEDRLTCDLDAESGYNIQEPVMLGPEDYSKCCSMDSRVEKVAQQNEVALFVGQSPLEGNDDTSGAAIITASKDEATAIKEGVLNNPTPQ